MADPIGALRATTRAEAGYAGTTHRRAIIVLRFDDTPAQDYDVILPLLEERKLIAAFAVAQVFLKDFGGLGDPNGGKGLSVVQCLDMQARGMELMSHSRRHKPVTSPENFVDEVAGWAADARALGMNFDSMAQPGTWQQPDYYFDHESELEGDTGRVLAETFAAFEAYVYGKEAPFVRAAPSPHRYGQGNPTAENNPLASLKTYVDTAIRLGGCTGFLTHTLKLGTPGTKLDLAGFTAFLDYVAAKRDAGLVDVQTPTSSLFSHQADSPQSFMQDASLRAQATGAIVPPWYAVGSPTISQGTGRTAATPCAAPPRRPGCASGSCRRASGACASRATRAGSRARRAPPASSAAGRTGGP